MTSYSLSIADETLSSKDQKARFVSVTGDIRLPGFAGETLSEGSADTAWLLLGSLQHFDTTTDVLDMFRNVARYLKPDGAGTLVIELPHPRETFCMTECTRNGWNVPLDGEDGEESGELRVVWGDDNDEFDPVSQVRQFTVKMELVGVEGEEETQSVKEVVPMRLFTVKEVEILAELSGVFEVVSMYGALDEEVDIRDDDLAFRSVFVLRTKTK